MFKLAEIKSILVNKTAQFSNDSEGYKQLKSSDEPNVLKRKIANGDIQYITFVKQLSLIGECSMNGVKKKKKFKKLTKDAASKSNKSLTKMELIGRLIRHSSDRFERKSTNIHIDQ
ncbi:uncharacterized protein LOC136095299 [Hydra vulgaris]|uniref:uncharacterized protein LOC136095299 n=1 Tax=Hydra vulgaris TaxID=6087 RepID=UPI0032EA6937